MNSELKTRILTALLLLIPTILGFLYLPIDILMVIIVAISMLCVHEYLSLMPLSKRYIQAISLGYFLASIILLVIIRSTALANFLQLTIPAIATILWLISTLAIITRQSAKLLKPNHMVMTLGLLVIIGGWVSVFAILTTRGAVSLLLLMALVWIADSGAYFAGKQFGKHKLAPSISPGKSIEGLIGALIATAVYLILIKLLHQPLVPIIFGIALVLISVIGDLTESQIKRLANAKDSGNFLPGHGGLLDRIDSLLAVLPFFWLYTRFTAA